MKTPITVTLVNTATLEPGDWPLVLDVVRDYAPETYSAEGLHRAPWPPVVAINSTWFSFEVPSVLDRLEVEMRLQALGYARIVNTGRR